MGTLTLKGGAEELEQEELEVGGKQGSPGFKEARQSVWRKKWSTVSKATGKQVTQRQKSVYWV